MKKKTKYATLLNFAEGNYSFKEYLKVKKWLNQAMHDKGTKELFFRHWDKLGNEEPKVPESLDHIFERINQQIQRKDGGQDKKWRVSYFYRQIAAALLLPLLSLSIWLATSHEPRHHEKGWVEITAPEGSRVHFVLPDSSSGWLNGGSVLKYAAMFQSRKVDLSGEAFFDVKHHDNADFTVEVGDMEVRVLGTKFNVSAYPNDSFKEVVLNEGRVEIMDSLRGYKRILRPHEKLRFDYQSNEYELTQVDADRFNTWTEGYLIIDDESLEAVVRKLERRYNAAIIIANDTLKSYHFKATFYDEPLEEVLRLIAMTTPISYTIETRNINEAGTLKQKKVMIKPK